MGWGKRQYEQRNNRWPKKNSFPGSRFPIDVTIEGDTGITQQFERQQNKEAVKIFNDRVKAWGQKVDVALRSSIQRWIVKDEKLSESLKLNYRHYGKRPSTSKEITSIGFSFKPEGLYVHLGVGKGYNMEGGTRILTKKSDSEWRRHPKLWFNPIIEQHVPELIEIVRDYCGKLIINTTRIYIN